ncbi:MAG: crotonase [Proteobacteria bacterium]|nr:crotonase [Pseudomonadota bacterium]
MGVVEVEWRDHAAVVTINRPEALNALNADVIRELNSAIDGIRREGIRNLIVTGAGSKAFVAGADIAAMKDLSRQEAKAFARRGQRVLHKLAIFPGVTIAAVDGFALGGGMELAMACDLIIAGGKSRFGQPEVNLGVIPGFGGTQRLERLVGAQRARELILTGRMIKADEAAQLGIALEVTEPGEALNRALELAATIASKGPRAVALAKEAIRVAGELDIEIGLQEEAELFAACFDTEDQTEGMSAFLEKREAQFKGK